MRNKKIIESVDLSIKKEENDLVIALAGNPNVGKSTLFNQLTGLKQHTGNWPGKTVVNAWGKYKGEDNSVILVDLPGTYSLHSHSKEEEVARDFICFGEADKTLVVCDATNIERNLNLVLQTLEITENVIVCLNLMDEARKKNIDIDIKKLSEKLGVAVITTSAISKEGLENLKKILNSNEKSNNKPYKVTYDSVIEEAINIIMPVLSEKLNNKIDARFTALKIINTDKSMLSSLNEFLGYDLMNDEIIKTKYDDAILYLEENGYSKDIINDNIINNISRSATDICSDCIVFNEEKITSRQQKIDKFLTNKLTGIPVMVILLAIVIWLTVTGANYPSSLLSNFLFYIEDLLVEFFVFIKAPTWLYEMLVFGVYRVLAWVVAVMLPPMAIFFPLFTLLEDIGYLPRIAFNLDSTFKKCSACGKQALSMCMGFGCNAAGVIGARIIDSPRERLIAILTNNFVPCNGRFPTLIAVLTMFFIGNFTTGFKSIGLVLLLTIIVLLGIIMTFLVSKILSVTLLKGVPSSFVLELPPYRKPKILSVIVRSIFDRTLYVLGRAIVVAAPAGLVIWILSNIMVGDITLLNFIADFLNPFASLIGLDGVILLAFILGFPANEIVVPIIIMSYISAGSIMELDNLSELKTLLVDNGWTWVTAVCVMLFSLFHWPCSTTFLTIKKETNSWKWALVSFLIPTIIGILICFTFTTVANIFI